MVKQHNDYYTYAYLRKDKTPYYIGKGRGKRIYSKSRSIKAPKDKSLILYLKKNLTEAEAFKHEIYMIFVLGRKDLGTGILRNQTDGGEGASGAVRSEEAKKKISVANSGKTHTEETKKKMSVAKSGEKHPMYGVPRTEEWKKAQSEKMSGALSISSKAIIAIKPDGTELHFGSGWEAVRELGIPQSNLRYFLKNGKQSKKGKCEGWQFFYENSEMLIWSMYICFCQMGVLSGCILNVAGSRCKLRDN